LTELAGRLSALGDGAEETSVEAFELLRSVLGAPDIEGLAARLAVEYTRLFRGLRDGYGPPPPYESLYRGSRLMGGVTVAVVGRYAEAGFGVIDEAVGPQDHIAAELKFMSLLCYDEIAAWDRDDRGAAVLGWGLQRRFLDEHLLRWVPGYCRRIKSESVEPFYAGAAMITEKALAADRALLGDLLRTTEVG
jgi:TorA maturation chaperone TorD